MLEDGQRITIVRNGDRRGLRNDARHLSAILERPLWDATDALRRPLEPRATDPTSRLAGPGTALERLNAMVEDMTEPTVAAPAEFDDPVAKKADWGHMSNGGGLSFRSRRFVLTSPTQLELRPVPMAIAIYSFIVFAGLALVVVTAGTLLFDLLLSGFTTIGLSFIRNLVGLLFGLLFTAIGVWIIRRGSIPIVFDIGRGEYRKGRATRRRSRSTSAHRCGTRRDR